MSSKEDVRWIVTATVCLCLAFGTFIFVCWLIGLFDFTGSEARAKVVASVLALIGAFITSMVTFIGLLIKRSIDDRNLALKEQAERRLQIESERNYALGDEAEKRLRMETVIRAVDLFSTEAGIETPKSQKAGALFALANLEQLDFALALLEQLWPNGEIDTTSATWLIDQGLNSERELTQRTAAHILNFNAHRLTTASGGVEFPSSLLEAWNPSLEFNAKALVLMAMTTALLSKPLVDWRKTAYHQIVVFLERIRVTDPDGRINAAAAVCLDALIPAYPEGYRIFLPDGYLSIDKIKTDIAASDAINSVFDSIRDLASRLSSWREEPSPPKAGDDEDIESGKTAN